jgi:hypothetical protein
MKKHITIILIIMIPVASMAFAYSSKLEGTLMRNQGFFGAAFLYQTYYSIGMASDAWTSNSYTPNQAKNILQHSINFLESALEALQELIEYSISKDDRAVFLQMIEIAGDLKNQGTHMIQYIESRQDEDLQLYDKYRKLAHGKIQNMLKSK